MVVIILLTVSCKQNQDIVTPIVSDNINDQKQIDDNINKNTDDISKEKDEVESDSTDDISEKTTNKSNAVDVNKTTIQIDTNDKDSEEKPKIIIKSLAFEPGQVKIKVNTTVVWEHQDNYKGFDELKHKITVYGITTSPILKFGETFEVKFTKPGYYTFVDSIYPEMKGTIIVEK